MSTHARTAPSFSSRVKMTGRVITVLGLGGILFMKPLMSRVFPNSLFSDYLMVCLIMVFGGIRLEGVLLFFKIRNIRRVIRRKAGFTFMFCILCAGLLLVAGWVYPRPDLNHYGIHPQKAGDAFYAQPPVFVPGWPVKLYIVSPQRRLHKFSMDGVWKAADIHADLKIDGDSASYSLDDIVSITDSDAWENKGDERSLKYYNRGGNPLYAAKITNKPFIPWVRFNVPSEEGLKGKTAVVSLRMNVTYPLLVSAKKYDLAEFKINESFAIQLASDAQKNAYSDFQLAELNWEQFRKMRLMALLIFCFFAALIRMFVRFNP